MTRISLKRNTSRWCWPANTTLVTTQTVTTPGSFAVLTWPVFFVGIDDLVEPAVADQPPVGQGQTGALGHDGLLDLHHLGHVVATRPELGLSDSVVNTVQHFPANMSRHVTPRAGKQELYSLINVTPVVNATKVSDKILNFHSLLRLEVRSVKISVEENYCEGKDEDGVLGVQFC